MDISRKSFLKKACISGACFCGFTSLFSAPNTQSVDHPNHQNDLLSLTHQWINELMMSLNDHLGDEMIRIIIKNTSAVHYQNLNMNAVLEPYKGNLSGFIAFLEQEWGWKVVFNPDKKILIADENKAKCVCPIISLMTDSNATMMCYCSEGFAEQMFSLVTQTKVKASVISPVKRGDKSCKYKIELS